MPRRPSGSRVESYIHMAADSAATGRVGGRLRNEDVPACRLYAAAGRWQYPLYCQIDPSKGKSQEILRCWCEVAGVMVLMADSQNTLIRITWTGWPPACENHTGRRSMPTQEAEIPVIKCFPCPDPKKWNSRSENRELFFRFCGKTIDKTQVIRNA